MTTAGVMAAQYGAVELKRVYQKNWLTGLLIAVAIHLMIVGTYFLVGILSAIAGDNLGYWIGRRYGQEAIARYGRWVLLTPARLDATRRFVTRYGAFGVFAARFIAGLRFMAGPIAGSTGLPPLAFVAALGTFGLLIIGVQPPNQIAGPIVAGGVLLLLAGCTGTTGSILTEPADTQNRLTHDVIDVSVGSLHACALNRDGSIACWGSDWQGLGVTTPPRPTPPPRPRRPPAARGCCRLTGRWFAR